MAHLAPHLKHPHNQHAQQQPSTAAIFSPSVARAAASTAKDWSYVDDWLHRKYHYGGKRHKPPPFERNPDTLKVLLALAAANEAADEERAQLLKIEEAALRDEEKQIELRKQEQQKKKKSKDGNGNEEGREEEEEESGTQIVEGILTALEEGLSRDGRAALDAMTSMAVELGEATPTPQKLAASFVELQGQLCEAEMAAKRVGVLQSYLEGETARIDGLLRKIRGGGSSEDERTTTTNSADHHHHHHNENLDSDLEYDANPSHSHSHTHETTSLATLAQQNLTLQRAVKATTTQLPELMQQVTATERAVGGPPNLTVDEVAADEAAYLDLLRRKRDLDRRIETFAGLPPDVEAARAELEGFRAELRGLTERRDANFERLVERESPVKTRRAGRRV